MDKDKDKTEIRHEYQLRALCQLLKARDPDAFRDSLRNVWLDQWSYSYCSKTHTYDPTPHKLAEFVNSLYACGGRLDDKKLPRLALEDCELPIPNTSIKWS